MGDRENTSVCVPAGSREEVGDSFSLVDTFYANTCYLKASQTQRGRLLIWILGNSLIVYLRSRLVGCADGKELTHLLIP